MTATERKRGARLAPGTSVGVYDVVRLLAEGGMGRVYEVVDPSIDKPYVIKTLKRDMLGKPDAAERMRLEQRALAELDHPNIVRIITAGEHEGSPYLVMEKLGGATLRHVLGLSRPTLETAIDERSDEERARDDAQDDQVPPQRPIRWEVACFLAIELLEALAVAHEHPLGIVHRDVKPENVFVLEVKGRPHVKLVDFGIASLSNSAKQTVGMFRGTPRYAAPEQLRGERVTYATDLYAVGLVLFEMIVGRDPFWGERQLAIGRAHLEKSPPPVTSLAPTPSPSSSPIPDRLDALIASALAKNPAERPPSATAFAEDLRSILQAADPNVVRDAERAFVERIRGTETIASTHDLLAGLGMGAPDSVKVAQAARPRMPDPNEHAATLFAPPPVMTVTPNEASAANAAALPPAQWMTPNGGSSDSPFEQMQPSPAPHTSSMAGWAVAGALGGALVVALIALRGGRNATPAAPTDFAAVTGTAPIVEPAHVSPSAAPAASTTADPIVQSATPAPTATSTASSSGHAPARVMRPSRPAVPARPVTKNADVDGVPHVASGL